jgi:P2 family phage contractile tail tube protein
MALRINKVYDANIYLNHDNKHGLASEVTCPEISYILEEYDALGLVGSPQFAKGVEAMEATITWKYPDSDAQIALANPFQAVDIMVCASKSVYDGGGLADEQPIRIFLKGFSKGLPAGGFKGKDDVSIATAIAVNYYKLEVNLEEILEIDAVNNRFVVGGNDIMAERRLNLGI